MKGKTQINKKNNLSKPNIKAKWNIKSENNDKTEDVKIKKEDDKEKEGDSLLDLLELEMRARAIRALIRKEEDIIPSTNPSQTNDSQQTRSNTETSEDNEAKENCRKQLERIISSQQSKGEDEDVVLVIPKPAPVVELLSSDSDVEETRINQEKNERVKVGKSASNSDENSIKSSTQDLKERKEIQEIIEIHGNTKMHLTNTSKAIMPERNVDIKNNMLSISISANNVAERRKKSKKKSRAKSQLASTITNSSELKQIDIADITETSDNKSIKSRINPSENKMIIEEENKTKQEVAESKVEEERSIDLDDIDLDDYCEVMDIENSDEDKSQDKIIIPSEEENKQSVSQTTLPKSDSTETWASRYYQTDDVQNVIKESKIQSEIRKRLRERQRLSKLNKSPNLNLSAQPSTTDATATFEKAPTGSVEEYLALKRALNTTINNINNTTIQVQCTSNINNNTVQDNSAGINVDSDIKAKENVVQDETISSHQESTDNDAQKAAISETVIAKPAEIVVDTENNTQSESI